MLVACNAAATLKGAFWLLAAGFGVYAIIGSMQNSSTGTARHLSLCMAYMYVCICVVAINENEHDFCGMLSSGKDNSSRSMPLTVVFCCCYISFIFFLHYGNARLRFRFNFKVTLFHLFLFVNCCLTTWLLALLFAAYLLFYLLSYHCTSRIKGCNLTAVVTLTYYCWSIFSAWLLLFWWFVA